MIRINNSNIYIGHIKQLLKDFNLPNCKVYRNEYRNVLSEDCHYIYNNGFYICKNGELDYLYNYDVNDKIDNITTNFDVRNLIYDNTTHKYLGRYLRYLKDFVGLNLMSLYNCNYGNQVSNLGVSVKVNDNLNVEFSGKDNGYIIYSFPVRFFEEYTIAIDCDSYVDVFVGLNFDEGIENYTNNNYDSNKFFEKTFDRIRSNSFLKPYVYKKLKNLDSNFINYKVQDSSSLDYSIDRFAKEELLTMFIKVPKSCSSSLVVLEGDFSKCFNINYKTNKMEQYMYSYKKDKDSDEILWSGDYLYLSKPELISPNNTRGNYVLSERLIEYLSENAITMMSESYDIKKVQKSLMKKRYLNSGYLGMWNENIRQSLYKYINDKNLNNDYYDVLSYVDKNVEKSLGDLI